MRGAGTADVSVEGSLSPAEFARLAAFVHQHFGIKLPPAKQAMVEGRLRRRLAASGADSLAAYCAEVLAQGEHGAETAHLVDALTTNKTDFFREPDHFRILAEQFLPQLCQPETRLKVWSSACSTGAEPYTLAMVIDHFLQTRNPGRSAGPPPSILATDISGEVLEVARRGIYPADLISPVPAEWRRRYLLRARQNGRDTVRIVPALRSMVRFGRLNLMAQHYPVEPDFDVIFCRNVLIYFDRDGQAAVLRRLCGHLRPGGALVLGHSESVNGIDLPVRAVGHTIFRRT